MRRLLLTSFILVLLCMSGIGAAIWAGHRRPLPARVSWLHLHDCESPCLMGITLNKTGYDAGQRILAEASLPTGYSARFTEESNDSLNLRKVEMTLRYQQRRDSTRATFYFRDGLADWLSVDEGYTASSLTLADAVGLWGAPACAYLMPTSEGQLWDVFIIDGDLMIAMTLLDFQLRWQSPVTSLSLHRSQLDTTAASPCRCSRWRGVGVEYPISGTVVCP